MALENIAPKRSEIEEMLKAAPVVGIPGKGRVPERAKKRMEFARDRILKLDLPQKAKDQIISDLEFYPIVQRDLPKPASREV